MPSENDVERVRELAIRRRRRRRSRRNQIAPSGLEQFVVLAQRGPKPAPYAVARDGISDRAAHRERDPRWLLWRRDPGSTHLECSGSTTTPMSDRPEHCAVTNGPDQAERLERPLPRRRPMTARPPRVRIRMRKPREFFRFRLLGWQRLFHHVFP